MPPKALAIPEEIRERVRVAIFELERRGEKVTHRAVREACKPIGGGPLSTLMKLHGAALMPPLTHPWSGATVPTATQKAAGAAADVATAGATSEAVALADRAAKASTPEERRQVLADATRLALSGKLQKWQHDAVLKAFEATPIAEAVLEEDDEPDLERQRAMLATDDALELARAFDLIMSDDRRRRVLEYVTRELDQDVAEHPNVDRGGARGSTPPILEAG